MELKEGDVGNINKILQSLMEREQIEVASVPIRAIGVSEDDFEAYARFIEAHDLAQVMMNYRRMKGNHNTRRALSDDTVMAIYNAQQESKAKAALETVRLVQDVKNGLWHRWEFLVTAGISLAALAIGIIALFE